jgi:hypothetical protein
MLKIDLHRGRADLFHSSDGLQYDLKEVTGAAVFLIVVMSPYPIPSWDMFSDPSHLFVDSFQVMKGLILAAAWSRMVSGRSRLKSSPLLRYNHVRLMN